MKNKKSLTFFFLLIIFVILGIIVWGSKNKNKETNILSETNMTQSEESEAPIFFYGNTCPHCADIEAWMKENKIEEKTKIVKKEVYDNRANSLELAKAAESCGLSTDSIGVPFLYTPEGECLIGTPDVISYLSDRVGLSDNNESTNSGKEGEL